MKIYIAGHRGMVGGAILQADEFGGICRFYDMPVL